MDWVGNVLVPIGILVISTVFTFVLARANRDERRQAMLFERDVKLADDFIRRTNRVRSRDFLVGPGPSRENASQELLDALSEFFSFVSGDPDEILASYLGEQWNTVDKARKWASRTQHPLAAASDPPLAAAQLRVLHAKTDTALDEIRTVVRAWPHPELRLEQLEAIHDWRVGRELIAPSDRKLAVDRLMLTSVPSRFVFVQALRRFSIWTRTVKDDWAYGRLPSRFELWRASVETKRRARLDARAGRPAARQKLREDRELRKLQEAAMRFRARRAVDNDSAVAR